MNQSVPWPWPLQSQNCEKRLCWIHGLRYFITEQPEQTETPFPILMLRFPFHSTESGLCPQMDTSVPSHLVSPPSELTLPASHLENPCKLLQWCLSDNHRIPCLSPTPRMPNHPMPFTGISNYLDKYAQSSQFFYFPRDAPYPDPPVAEPTPSGHSTDPHIIISLTLDLTSFFPERILLFPLLHFSELSPIVCLLSQLS